MKTHRGGTRPLYRRLRITTAVCFLSLLFLAALPGSGNTDTATEYQVKAAFLYNFGKFVYWPENDMNTGNGYIHISILGDNPFGEALKNISGKMLGNRETRVRVVEDIEDSLDHCHILYIKTDKISTGRILERIGDEPILTVSDEDGFAKAGGIVELFTVGKKVRFTINSKAAHKAGLEISSKLLKLSVPVEERSK